jgi:hypothetical protein
MTPPRRKVPASVQTEVLVRSRRRCCVCFGLDRNQSLKEGQIAHLDGNRNNNDPSNLAFLCLDHHNKYDGQTSQAKGLTPGEVARYREELHSRIRMNLWFENPPTKVKIYRDSREYFDQLTKMVTSAEAVRQPLYVSVGTADFVSGWITRICREQPETVQITELVIVRMSDARIRSLEKQGLLQKGFLQTLKANIRVMTTDSVLRQRAIRVLERHWKGQSPFHGYCYGTRVLVGTWAADADGKISVKTPLHDTDETNDPEVVSRVRRAFTELERQATRK